MPTAKPTRRALACLAVLTLFPAGCGDKPKLGRVSGRVTYKGQPVPNGTVTFVPNPSGPPATATIGPDGTYTMQTPDVGEGALVGQHAVMILALRAGTAAMGAEERDPLPPPIIPIKYGNTSTSGLTAEVREGDNTVNFDLVDDKPAPKK